ncbi:hypothetical protein BOTBODRAFT_79731, partial [Botryobasidium botryosum FD-172 SS1]
CPICHSDVYTHEKKPRPILTFDYLPLLPCITALYSNVEQAVITQTYCSTYATAEADPLQIQDVFDSELYKELCHTPASYRGCLLGHNHFSQPTDLALGFWADGFQLFKCGSNDC